MRVVVIGAGISGLAAATFLHHKDIEVVVLDAAGQAGGNVRTLQSGNRSIDRAANGWLDSEPAMSELLRIAGLDAALSPASTERDTRFIFHKRAWPVPMSPPALLKSGLLPWWAKLRLVLEPILPRGPLGESVAQFVRRRLGSMFVPRMVGPMVSGIYAADPEALELASAFPRMAELEREHRSLFLAMMRLKRGGAPRGHLTSLKGGAGRLTEGLASRLDVRVNQRVRKIEPGWTVTTDTDTFKADVVVLATPGYVQAKLLAELSPDAASAQGDIPYAPVAVVATAAEQDMWPTRPTGFGVLTATDADLGGVLGVLFTHDAFPDQPGPNELLLRTVIGGARYPQVKDWSDEQVVACATAAHTTLFGTATKPPLETQVFRYDRGIPQYNLGHADRVQRAMAAEQLPGLFLTGNHLHGIAVKDCARSGRDVANRVELFLKEQRSV